MFESLKRVFKTPEKSEAERGETEKPRFTSEGEEEKLTSYEEAYLSDILDQAKAAGKAGDFERAEELLAEHRKKLEDIKIKREKLESWLQQGENREKYEKLEQEFNRQVDNLSKKGFPKLAGMDEKKFAMIFEPLKEQLRELSLRKFKEGHIPFVVVPREKLLSLKKKIPLMRFEGKKGFTTMNLSEFKTAEGVEIPESMAYLAVDIENGKDMLGKSADEAIKQFKKEGRSPLTMEEGVALVLQHPEILKDHYMDLPGSYLPDSYRGANGVAALWLEEYLWLHRGKPSLFWNRSVSSRRSWGSASCGSRVR